MHTRKNSTFFELKEPYLLQWKLAQAADRESATSSLHPGSRSSLAKMEQSKEQRSSALGFHPKRQGNLNLDANYFRL